MVAREPEDWRGSEVGQPAGEGADAAAQLPGHLSGEGDGGTQAFRPPLPNPGCYLT